MKSELAVAMIISAVIGVAGCSESTGPKPQPFIYPLEVGTRWIYDHVTITDYHGDKPSDTTRGVVTVTVDAIDTLATLGPSARVHSDYIDLSGEWEGVHYYQNREDGLHWVAACGTNDEALPKRRLRGSDLASWRHGLPRMTPAEALGPPDICEREGMHTLEDEPLVLQYPLHIGDRWLFRDPEVTGIEILRVVERWEKVRADAGTFWCYRVRWDYPSEPHLDVIDHVSQSGLIRRSITLRDAIFSDPGYELGNDTADVFVTMQLKTLIAPGVP